MNVRDLDRFEEGDEVTPETLKAKGLIRSVRKDVKLLGIGELTKKLSITVHGASATAREKVEAAGGTLTLLREPKVRKPKNAKRRPETRPQTSGTGAAEDDAADAADARRRRGGADRAKSLAGGRRGLAPLLSWVSNAWRVPDLRKRLLFTAAMLAAYRLGSWMPAPGVDSKTIQSYFNGQGGVFSLLNLFSGSALSRFSIFALGIMPYVTASIILQLMTVVIPSLEQLQKEGEAGTAKINQYTRYLTIVLALAQGSRLHVPLPPPGRAARKHRPPAAGRGHPHRGHALF